jgi:hypothetical protein
MVILILDREYVTAVIKALQNRKMMNAFLLPIVNAREVFKKNIGNTDCNKPSNQHTHTLNTECVDDDDTYGDVGNVLKFVIGDTGYGNLNSGTCFENQQRIVRI